ncbi:hypothetical protein B0O80DRAFT_454613, partial [Mortierella sp. GBAus27b]
MEPQRIKYSKAWIRALELIHKPGIQPSFHVVQNLHCLLSTSWWANVQWYRNLVDTTAI